MVTPGWWRMWEGGPGEGWLPGPAGSRLTSPACASARPGGPGPAGSEEVSWGAGGRLQRDAAAPLLSPCGSWWVSLFSRPSQGCSIGNPSQMVRLDPASPLAADPIRLQSEHAAAKLSFPTQVIPEDLPPC